MPASSSLQSIHYEVIKTSPHRVCEINASTVSAVTRPVNSKHSCSSRASVMMRSVVFDTLKWIENNLDEDLHVVRLAQRSGYTRWHFQRCFKEITGCSLSQYVRHRRLTHATDAILHTHDPIIDIAYKFGYTSQQTLSRIVRSALGMSPTQLRQCMYFSCDAEKLLKNLDAARLP